MNYLEKKIKFHEDEIITFMEEETGVIYVGVAYICNNLGMTDDQKKTQVKKVQEEGTLKLGVKKLSVKIDTQVREQIFIELDYVHLWLAKINPKNFNEKLKEKLLDYQLHCKDILADAFFGKRELLLPGHNDEKFNPSLNDIDNRSPIIRNIESEIVRLYGLLRYHYGWIKERARVQETECENQINKMKQKFFIVDGEELTTKDIDRLNHM